MKSDGFFRSIELGCLSITCGGLSTTHLTSFARSTASSFFGAAQF